MNFEKYNDLKPDNDLKLKIQNFFMEYHESQDREHAISEFKDIIEVTKIPVFIFVGNIIKNAFSLDDAGWNRIFKLLVDEFYIKEKLFEGNDLMEGINVSMV